MFLNLDDNVSRAPSSSDSLNICNSLCYQLFATASICRSPFARFARRLFLMPAADGSGVLQDLDFPQGGSAPFPACAPHSLKQGKKSPSGRVRKRHAQIFLPVLSEYIFVGFMYVVALGGISGGNAFKFGSVARRDKVV